MEEIVDLDVSNLWGAYMNNSMATCVNQYALQTIKNQETNDIFRKALRMSENNVQIIIEILNKEHFPIPLGFTNEDVNLDAPRLFSDEFLLVYLFEMAITGLVAYSLGLSTAKRVDVRNFYITAFNEANDLYNLTLEMLQSKSLMDHPPTIKRPEKVEFAEKQSYIAGWFGNHRPLNVIEITSLYFNLKKSNMIKTLILGFSQTAQSKEVKDFMLRLVELGNKHIDLFRSILQKDYVNSPSSWDTHITDSTIAPFSDKLMMFHSGFLLQSAMAYYGTAFSSSTRRDLSLHYATAIADDAKVAEDGMNIMIANSWFEQPPQTVDRRGIQKK